MKSRLEVALFSLLTLESTVLPERQIELVDLLMLLQLTGHRLCTYSEILYVAVESYSAIDFRKLWKRGVRKEDCFVNQLVLDDVMWCEGYEYENTTCCSCFRTFVFFFLSRTRVFEILESRFEFITKVSLVKKIELFYTPSFRGRSHYCQLKHSRLNNVTWIKINCREKLLRLLWTAGGAHDHQI